MSLDQFLDTPPAQPEDGIGLALSGGGYRAMVFHVGALIRLNEVALLLRRLQACVRSAAMRDERPDTARGNSHPARGDAPQPAGSPDELVIRHLRCGLARAPRRRAADQTRRRDLAAGAISLCRRVLSHEAWLGLKVTLKPSRLLVHQLMQLRSGHRTGQNACRRPPFTPGPLPRPVGPSPARESSPTN
jgi:hypothetical protein